MGRGAGGSPGSGDTVSTLVTQASALPGEPVVFGELIAAGECGRGLMIRRKVQLRSPAHTPTDDAFRACTKGKHNPQTTDHETTYRGRTYRWKETSKR